MSLAMKFGGTSVGSAEAMRQTAELILKCREQHGEVTVVASAMGSKPVKVTDLLLNGANAAAAGDDKLYLTNSAEIQRIHQTAITDLLTDEREAISAEIARFIGRYNSICQAVLMLGELTDRALDVIGGMGEQMSTRVLAAYLREIGHDAVQFDATDLIRTDSNFLNATPDLEITKAQTVEKVRPILDRGGIPIITGFIGADENGITTTLGRGGSDYSGSILGYALDVDEVWIWTDVDGVMSADPRLVKNAISIPELTYREISELAYYGARVLHPKTMRPVVENGIALRIKNTFNPDHQGTVILKERDYTEGNIKAVTAIKDLRFVTVEGKGMIGVQGVAARTFSAVAASNVSVLLITQASSEQSICFATPAGHSDAIVASLEAEFAEEIKSRDIDRIWVQRDVSILTVVGAGMQGTPGIAGKVFGALGDAGVNIVAIAQGSSECNISIVISGGDTDRAVTLVHDLIV